MLDERANRCKHVQLNRQGFSAGIACKTYSCTDQPVSINRETPVRGARATCSIERAQARYAARIVHLIASANDAWAKKAPERVRGN